MKAYIAGHRGLVGSAILRRLKENNSVEIISRTSKELDLKRQSDTEFFFERERPEHVYLAAAKVGGILANNTYKAEFIYDNMAIALNVINSAYKSGVKKLLNLGSSCIYPRLVQQPMKEEYLLTGMLEPTNEPYAIAKISAIKLCRYYNEQFGTNYISVMPTNIYGPGDNFNLETSHVLSALIRKFHLAKLLRKGDFEGISKDMKAFPLGFGIDGNVIPTQVGIQSNGLVLDSSFHGNDGLRSRTTDTGTGFSDEASISQPLAKLGITKDYVLLWGSGEPYREFLYADDLANACVYLMENYDYKDIGEFVNVGTGEDLKIKELANLVKETVGFDGEIKHDISKPDGMPKKLLDISRIKGLGWEAKINLKEGIRKTYEWYNKVSAR